MCQKKYNSKIYQSTIFTPHPGKVGFKGRVNFSVYKISHHFEKKVRQGIVNFMKLNKNFPTIVIKDTSRKRKLNFCVHIF